MIDAAMVVRVSIAIDCVSDDCAGCMQVKFRRDAYVFRCIPMVRKGKGQSARRSGSVSVWVSVYATAEQRNQQDYN